MRGLVVASLIIVMIFSTIVSVRSQSGDSEMHSEKMYCKKVIIRDDDVDARGRIDPSICLDWLTNLTIEKNIKVTYGLIVGNETFSDNVKLVDYLNNLDKTHFEIATHGYTHEHFKGMPYDEQYSRIENATKTIENYLHIRPYTFIAPFHSDDENTSKACAAIGYHSFPGRNTYSGNNMIYFKADKCLETNWNTYPPEHHSIEALKSSFEKFYLSNDELYVFVMHHNTFWNENETEPNTTKTNNFEKFVDYMKTKNVEFMTMEEAYQWYVNKNKATYNIDFYPLMFALLLVALVVVLTYFCKKKKIF